MLRDIYTVMAYVWEGNYGPGRK